MQARFLSAGGRAVASFGRRALLFHGGNFQRGIRLDVTAPAPDNYSQSKPASTDLSIKIGVDDIVVSKALDWH
jgi:hypothetical protein